MAEGGAELTIGMSTAGRPDAIEDCLRALDRHVALEYETIVVDNTPQMNEEVPYEVFDVDRLNVEQTEGPSASRQRILDAVGTDYLLLIDDDTFPEPGTVESMYETVRGTDAKLVSGIWNSQQIFDWHNYIGSVYQWATRDDARVLIDVQISGTPLRDRGFTTVTLDEGLPTVLLDTAILDTVAFDTRYDWFYEWIDFYLQCHEIDESVTVDLEAEFVHHEYPYTGETIRYAQSPEQDRRRLLDKWDIKLNREAALSGLSYGYWESFPIKLLSLYKNQGIEGVRTAVTTSVTNKLGGRFGE